MRKIILAAALAIFVTPAAFAQTAQTDDGMARPGTTVPDTSVPERQGQYGPSNDPSKQFGTDDQRDAPNAACPKGSTNPECQHQKMRNKRPGTGNTGTAPNGPANPGPNPGQQGSGG